MYENNNLISHQKQTDDIQFENEEVEEYGNNFNYLPEEKREVFIDRSQLSVYEIHRRFKRGDIILRPIYQRGFVWKQSKKAKLIESILVNISIPSIYLAETEEGKWEVVDGQQRLNSLFDFLEGKFKLSSLPVLTHLNTKNFNNLNPMYQRKIEDYQLHIFIIKKESHPDIRFNIFERINEGATPLNAQELRNCTFQGERIELLKRLSETKEFITVTQRKGLQTNRLQGHEAVLRFLSFYVKGYDSYFGNLSIFLNETLENFDKYKRQAKEFELIFPSTMQTIFNVFGEWAFVKSGAVRKTLNFALFDVITYSFSKSDHEKLILIADEIQEALLNLIEEDFDFNMAISANTLTNNNVQYRFQKWMETLEYILKG